MIFESKAVSPTSSVANAKQAADYVVISPVRNEEQFIRHTINSVVAQTARPAEWLIVDDGSTDKTWPILQEVVQQHSWIRAVKRPDRGYRHPGTGVVEAFYDGYETVASREWQFLVKLDGDLAFESDYFSECLSRFERDSTLGIGGGLICAVSDGRLVPESKLDPAFHVRGATKIYRRKCWEDIGGLLRSPGWDGMDEIKANMLGWRTLTFPDLRLRHFRPAGLAYGRWKDWIKGGRGNYMAGYHPLFMVAKALRRFGIRPYGIASLGLLTGYFGGSLKRIPRIADVCTVRYVRQQQMNRMLGRKSIWDSKPDSGVNFKSRSLPEANSRSL